MKRKILKLWKETKEKLLSILKNKENKFYIIIIGSMILLLIILLLGSTFISSYKIIRIIKMIILALYGGLTFMIIRRRSINMKRKKIKNSTKSKKRIRKKRNIFYLIGAFILIIGILTLVGISLFLGYIVISAPPFDPNSLYKKEASIIYDKDNEIITKIGREIRDKISYDDIPQIFIDAIIATEDARYFQHNGFDAPRFIKASLGQLAGKNAGGASTITMQVVRNNITSRKQTIVRKLTDIYISIFKLEKKYTKEEILEFYVNAPFLGNNSYGIAEAARNYFGKEMQDINLSEAALLAGLFQAPSAYDPYIYPENAERRRTTVLYLMKRHGYITEEEERIANAIPVESLLIEKSKRKHQIYQGYIDTVIDEVEKKTGYSPYNMPMKIYTNYHKEKQQYLEDVLSGKVFNYPNDVVQVGIAVTDINTGAVIAIGNGRNRSGERLFNFATMLKRQIGSTAKPIFEYGVGMETNNWSTYTLFLDDVHSYSNGKKMSNWDNKYNGLLTLKSALAQSRNVPALKAFQQLKNEDIVNFALSLGMTPELEDGKVHEAHAVGSFNGASPLQMAAAYAAFGNGGYYIEPYTINKIEFMDTNEVIIFKPNKTKVMEDSTAFMITDILRYGVNTGIIGGGKVPGVQVAAKSGTTSFDDKTIQTYKLSSNAVNDLWYVGYSPDYAIGMWFGYEKIDPKYHHTTANWGTRNRLFTTIAKGIFEKNGKTFTVPKSVVRVEVEKETAPAMLPSPYTPANMRTYEYFKKGTEPTEVSPRFNTLPNPTNVDIKVVGSEVKITWNHVSPRNTITDELIKVFGIHKDKYINKRLANDLEILGTLGYNVYLKQGDELHLLGWTANNEFIHRPQNPGNLTYVIKTCYSIFKDNKSSGVEITISDNPYVEILLVGEPVIKLPVGGTYEERWVRVLENLVDVTDQADIDKETKRMSDGQIIPNNHIDTSAPETYTIKYIVTYKGEIYTTNRTVIIE